MTAHVILVSGGRSRRLVGDVGEFRQAPDTNARFPVTALAGEAGVVAVDWQMRS